MRLLAQFAEGTINLNKNVDHINRPVGLGVYGIGKPGILIALCSRRKY